MFTKILIFMYFYQFITQIKFLYSKKIIIFTRKKIPNLSEIFFKKFNLI